MRVCSDKVIQLLILSPSAGLNNSLKLGNALNISVGLVVGVVVGIVVESVQYNLYIFDDSLPLPHCV